MIAFLYQIFIVTELMSLIDSIARSLLIYEPSYPLKNALLFCVILTVLIHEIKNMFILLVPE